MCNGSVLAERTLRVRWLGRVAYRDALGLQRALFVNRQHEYLLLLEHPHVVTTTRRTPAEHLLADVESAGADLVEADRGGDVTYHGPGQLVAYPIVEVPGRRGGGMADTAAYAASLEQVLIETLGDLGVHSGRRKGCTGVWVESETDRPQKIAAIGVRIARGWSMHGVALNVDPDLSWFERIVPCGIADAGVTSLAALGVDVSMSEVVEVFTQRAVATFAPHGSVDCASVGFRTRQADLAPFTRGEGAGTPVGRSGVGHGSEHPALAPSGQSRSGPALFGQSRSGPARSGPAVSGSARSEQLRSGLALSGQFTEQADGTSVRLLGRLAQAGATDHDPVRLRARKPPWMRVKFDPGSEYRRVRSTMRQLGLVTVCEEAGCPNISECWNDGTATFMILGDRCTRACGFCLIDTRCPEAPDPEEAARVAEAVELMGLRHAVVTMVARDDLDDGGAGAVAAVVAAIRGRTPQCRVETLVSDFKGCEESLGKVFDARPDVFNHNIETVARLQRAVRPSAGYARSLSVLARAKAADLVAKSSIIAGMGESDSEISQTLTDLAAVGVDIVTIGQYLRPTSHHLPVAQWWEPEMFEEWKRFGESAGIGHVESSPLTRSSYHARQSVDRLADNRG
ncbi:MAG: lipoyl synthase [Acidimicrobiaceae bacterium]|nr:lipoyl synthase [Acidimicrobiaceae bacterium]